MSQAQVSRETRWPRTYILQIHEKAVSEGCCRIGPLGEMQAKSLIAALYRIRRRGDSLHKLSMVPPEYHLVQFVYERERAELLCIYDSLPDGAQLPVLSSIPDEEKTRITPGPLKPIAPPVLDQSVDDLVQSLVADAAAASDQGPAPQVPDRLAPEDFGQ